MNKKTTLLLCLWFWIATYSCSFAVTIPPGTTLTVRTVTSISSRERVGRTFKAELDRDVVVNGHIVLPAGTPVSGVVASSLGDVRRSSAFTVNLNAILIHGRTVETKTTGAYKLQPLTTTKGGVALYGREYIYPRGTRMAFRLAKPLNL
jgi:hypothetical protein